MRRATRGKGGGAYLGGDRGGDAFDAAVRLGAVQGGGGGGPADGGGVLPAAGGSAGRRGGRTGRGCARGSGGWVSAPAGAGWGEKAEPQNKLNVARPRAGATMRRGHRARRLRGQGRPVRHRGAALCVPAAYCPSRPTKPSSSGLTALSSVVTASGAASGGTASGAAAGAASASSGA